jgi:hypothetical protein
VDMKSFPEILRLIRDIFWPLPDPLPPGYEKKRSADLEAKIEALPNEEASLEEYKTIYQNFLETEGERRQSVESRLTNVMGLASIAGSIVFGTILAQISGSLHLPGGPLRWLIAFGSFYLVMQICSAIYAAVCGLSRQNYITLTPADFLAKQNADKATHLRGLVAIHMKVLADHQSQNEKKITRMATAHRAMQQFLFGLMALALIGTGFAIKSPPAHDDLVETLKNNHELQGLIRGPVGPAGPTGSQGLPCINMTSPNSGPKH